MVQTFDTTEIVITASRAPEEAAETPASIIVIDEKRIDRLGEPQLAGLLRLVPSAAVSVSGPMGSIAEVRIRGAESNHTLLFIDGIRANDPAESNNPRFELINADIASRIEVVRGPQSALWGSEAIGGVIAVEGSAKTGPAIFAEAGSLGFMRGKGSWGIATPDIAASLIGAFQQSRGINNYAGSDEDGERDGFRNLAFRGRFVWKPLADLELGFSGFALSGKTEFDGYDPITFDRADTLDRTRNGLAAGRLWGSYKADNGFTAAAWLSRLGSSNRNYLDDTALNRTHGRRDSLGTQFETSFTTGTVDHRLIGAAELERERFEAKDFTGGFTNQDRSRNHLGVTVEWRASLAGQLVTNVAVRRDSFNRFKDTTTLRASAIAKPITPLEFGISYAEGIAQPNFIELYGFFPGGFTGNPDLRPERSRGVELTARYRQQNLLLGATVYRQRLRDEILTLFGPVNTTVNSERRSKRSGAELQLEWRPSKAAHLTATYAYLNATEPTSLGRKAPERRRPRHSGSMAVDGTKGRWSYGASLAFTGRHIDQRDELPFELVRLSPYWLAGVRVAYAVNQGFELLARAANAFDANYQDVVGYRTEGRSFYVGIRLADRR